MNYVNGSTKREVKYLLSFVEMVMNVGSSVGHGCQVLIILLQGNSGVLKLDIQ